MRFGIRSRACSFRRTSPIASTWLSQGLPRGRSQADELASRLSYFLWSSMPDAELLVPRRLRRSACKHRSCSRRPGACFETPEFAVLPPSLPGTGWVSAASRNTTRSIAKRFPSFTNELRQAMYEEPIRLFIDVVSRDRSILDLLYGNDTFVNPVLAKHYGMPVSKGGNDEWIRVDDAGRFGRGGLLPMSVFMTASSPGLRTSPVKRGYWVVRKLLGERIPPPPAVVPELPTDEAKPAATSACRSFWPGTAPTRTVRAATSVSTRSGWFSRASARSASGAIATWAIARSSPKATFPDGSSGDGLAGLRRYIADSRQDEFVDNLCRELLVYALGRGLILSDEPLIKSMRDRLSAEGHRFDSLIETIVVSPQFRNKRGRDDGR